MARFCIKEIAEAQGINISELQRRANASTVGTKLAYSTIHTLWHNTSQQPNLNTLAAIATALGVRTGDLIVDENLPEEPPSRIRAREGRRLRIAKKASNNDDV